MKKVLIIGAGIAGLSAGVYARRSGFGAEILEMHTIPGGNSTSWRRGGYLFEGGMHWLTGSSSGSPLHRLWQETGALREDTEIYNRDPFFTCLEGSRSVCLYRDPDRLERHLRDIAPEDAKMIHSLCRDIKKFRKMAMPVMDIKGVEVKHKSTPPLSLMFSMLSVLPRMNALGKISCGEYVAKFKNPTLRKLFGSMIGSNDFTANSIHFTLGTLAAGDGGYPVGGSLAMARNMASRFEELDGTIRYSTRAEKVILQDGRVTGVVAGGEFIPADAVIVTVDALAAVDALFDPPLHEPWMDEMRRAAKPLLNTFLCFGVEADLSELPENLLFSPKKPLMFAGESFPCLGINNYASFAGYAPKGCTAVTSALMGDSYDYWKRAKEDGSYQSKKERLASDMMDILGEQFPQMRGRFAVWDVATPLTYERYCGTYKGSWMTVMEPGVPQASYPLKAEVSGLYFAGQRMFAPGGLPVAVSTGRTAVQYLCRDSKTVFEGEI